MFDQEFPVDFEDVQVHERVERDYENLENLPQINSNTLIGNKTSSELGLASPSDVAGAVQEEAEARAEAVQNEAEARAGAIASEAEARASADSALSTRIDNEVSSREGSDTTLQSNIDAEALARQNAVTALQNLINIINGKIPGAASDANQLADKAFVNSSITTNTAFFRGTFSTADLGLTYDATHAQVEAALKTAVTTVTNNDYAFVYFTNPTTQIIERYDRYKYSEDDDSWGFEYTLNNSSFTAVQWATINSGLTSGDVEYIRALDTYFYTKTQVDELLNGKVDKVTGKGLSTNDLTTELVNLINSSVQGVQINGTDLTKVNNKVNIPYATDATAGAIKTGSDVGTALNPNYGKIYAMSLTYEEYNSRTNFVFVGKGTLENVFAGKQFKPNVVLTETEYNALMTKDPNVIYFVKEG